MKEQNSKLVVSIQLTSNICDMGAVFSKMSRVEANCPVDGAQKKEYYDDGIQLIYLVMTCSR